MKYLKFSLWLVNEKSLGDKSARDVISRLRRISSILNKEDLRMISPKELEATDSFQNCSMSVKSQLKRALTLYNEFSRLDK